MDLRILEKELTKIPSRLPILLCAIFATCLIVYPALVASQSYSIQLNNTLQDLRGAEAAGAKPSEMEGLIDRMNSVAALETQLQNTPTEDDARRAQLLQEINSTLASVDGQATQLEMIASQRTYMDHLIAYASAGIGAIAGTVAYYYGVELYRRYRTRLAFRMIIKPK